MRLRGFTFGALVLSFLAESNARNTWPARARRNVETNSDAAANMVLSDRRTANAFNHTTRPHGALTYITPSPGASPVAVTKESQIITSYAPQFTLCELPPIAEVSASPPLVTADSSAPYRNYSVSIPSGTGSCTTILSPTITMVCATVLTALDKRYTVTNCDQELTFASQYGYSLASPTSPSKVGNYSRLSPTTTPAPSVVTLTTFMLAPWQQLTAGTAPSDVDLKICKQSGVNMTECILEQQVWETSLITGAATSFTTVNISTTIHGSSQILVESFTANITEYVTTFSMSTTMAVEYQTLLTITNSANKTVVSTLPASSSTQVSSVDSTYTETITVDYAPSHSTASSGSTLVNSTAAPTARTGTNATSPELTTTSFVHVTSTSFIGTSTLTVFNTAL